MAKSPLHFDEPIDIGAYTGTDTGTDTGSDTRSKHSYKAKQRDLAAIVVYNTGFQKCSPRYQWGPGRRDHYLIHYVISGKGTYTFDGKTYTASAGQAFLAIPNTDISYVADAEDPWHYCWIGFNGMDAGMILERTAFKSSPVIDVDFGDKIVFMIRQLWEIRGEDLTSRLRMTGAVYSFLSLFVIRDGAIPTEDRYFEQAVDLIRRNYFSYTLTIDDIAGSLGITRSYLYTIFKKSCGMSPKDYLTGFRIQQAKSLLAHSRLNIASISYSVGYEDNLYFSKIFKKMTGTTPTQYRSENS